MQEVNPRLMGREFSLLTATGILKFVKGIRFEEILLEYRINFEGSTLVRMVAVVWDYGVYPLYITKASFF